MEPTPSDHSRRSSEEPPNLLVVTFMTALQVVVSLFQSVVILGKKENLKISLSVVG
jgi:hypothetical protein